MFLLIMALWWTSLINGINNKIDLQAEKGLDKALNYLEEYWTIKEIHNLEAAVKRVLIQISLNPELFPTAESYVDLRKALVDKKNYLVCRYNEKKQAIEIINFRGTKHKPKY